VVTSQVCIDLILFITSSISFFPSLWQKLFIALHLNLYWFYVQSFFVLNKMLIYPCCVCRCMSIVK
jgi:hypothetical protein